MASAKEQIRAILQQRQAQASQDDSKLRGMISDQEKIAMMDPAYRTNLQPTAAFVDELTGSNLARTVDKPESTQDALRKALQYRMQQPKVKTDALLGAMAKMDASSAKAGGLRQLSAKDVMTVQEGNNIPMMLDDVSKVIDQNVGLFGPVTGRLHANNPYDTQGKTVDAQVRAASQAFGRFMEGGVLRKEDEEKYRKMFPALSDTPEVAKNKLNVVNRILQQKQDGNLQALSGAGFDVSPFGGSQQQPQMQVDITDMPGQKGISSMSDEEIDARIKALGAQ